MQEMSMYIDGRWTKAIDGATFPTVDPYAGEPWAEVPDATEEDLGRAVEAARAAFADGRWSRIGGRARAARLRRLADLIEREEEPLAAVESRDNGKVVREMRAQMRALPQWYHYFAGLADKVEGRTIAPGRSDQFVYTRPEPIGVVGAIVPWNSPLLLATWKLAPALAAGCSIVLKPSDLTPVSALELARLVEEAEIPPGVVNVVTGRGPRVGEALVAHRDVDKVCFTGSTPTGIAVGRSGLEHLARLSLELGGKSAQVVLEDADVEAAANGVIAGIFAAGGQTCLAGSRVYAHEAIFAELVERVVERAGRIVLGDPRDPATEMGPLASAEQVAKVLGFIDGALAEGATARCGGGRPPGREGFFVAPTVLTGVPPESPTACEEIFGPVLVCESIEDAEQGIELANASRFGLAGSVWSASVKRALGVAHRLRAGTVYVNDYRLVDPAVPFGGMGLSGIGRESGARAIEDFLETKAVWVALEDNVRDPFVVG